MLQNGASKRYVCVCVQMNAWRSAKPTEQVSCDMRYRRDSIAILHDMGPIRSSQTF